MVGVVVRCNGRFVVATGPTQGYCEEIVFALLQEEGVDIADGEVLPMVVFDPSRPGGLLIDPSINPEDTSMEGWDLNGWKPS